MFTAYTRRKITTPEWKEFDDYHSADTMREVANYFARNSLRAARVEWEHQRCQVFNNTGVSLFNAMVRAEESKMSDDYAPEIYDGMTAAKTEQLGN